MNQLQIERGDIIALRDGREVEILSVRMDGDHLLRFDYLDRKEASPMRKTEYPSAILRLLRKGVIRNPNPKEERPYDNPVQQPLPVAVVNQEIPLTNTNSSPKKKGK